MSELNYETFGDADGSMDSLLSTYRFQRTEAAWGLSVRVAATARAIEELRPVWLQWAHSPGTDIDSYLHNLKTDSTILRPHVITVYEEGIPQAMLVGLVRKQKMSTVVSFVRLPGPSATVLAIPNAGRIGRQSSAIDRLLALELLKTAELGDVDLVCFQRLPLQSELFREVRQLSGPLARLRVPQIFRYSTLSLTAPAGKRPRVFSGKIAHEVRRKTRILQQAFPGKVRFKCFCRPSEFDAGIRDAMMVAATSWQNYLGCGVSNTSQSCDNLKLFANQGWLRIYVLYVKNIPRAYLIGQHRNHTFYCQHAGYHPDFARYSVGSLLTAWALESMTAAGVEQVDLGEGDQEHNRRLGCDLRYEGTVHVYSRTWRGFSLNIFFAATQILRDCGRRVLLRLRLHWVIKRWRQLLLSRWR